MRFVTYITQLFQALRGRFSFIVLDRIVGFLHKDSQFCNKFFQREGTLSKVVKLPHYYQLIGVWLAKIFKSHPVIGQLFLFFREHVPAVEQFGSVFSRPA